MDSGRLKEMANEAVRLNLRYYGALIDVTRDYLGALRGVVETGAAPPVGKRPARSAAAATPPLVLAAPAGQKAEAAFAVSNNADREVTADPMVSPELAEAGVAAAPSGRVMAPGEDAVFRLEVQIPDSMSTDADLHGSVSVPGLGDREIPVVLRRLPDAAPAAPKPRRSKKS